MFIRVHSWLAFGYPWIRGPRRDLTQTGLCCKLVSMNEQPHPDRPGPLARWRERWRAANNDPIHGPMLRAARHERIDGAAEISVGTMNLCMVLSSYLTVIPAASGWSGWISWLPLICGVLAPLYIPKAIKQHFTWPRSGYVSLRRPKHSWIGMVVTVLFACGFVVVLLRLMQPEINRLVKAEVSRMLAAASPPPGSNVMDSLNQTGKVTHGYLGINVQPLAPELAKAFNLPEKGGGVLAKSVNPLGAGAKAGLRQGDVILELNGKKTGDQRTLLDLLAENPVGTSVSFKYLHGEAGKAPVENTVTAVLGEPPPEPPAPAAPGAVGSTGGPSRLERDVLSPGNPGVAPHPLKGMQGVLVVSNALLYLMIAAGSLGKHPWKWLMLLVMVLVPLGICLLFPGDLSTQLPRVMVCAGLLWLISGGATLYLYLRHTPPPVQGAA